MYTTYICVYIYIYIYSFIHASIYTHIGCRVLSRNFGKIKFEKFGKNNVIKHCYVI